MSGSLLNRARKDFRKYITEGGAEESIVLTSANGFSIQTTGWHSKHHINFDANGNAINSKNAHICIHEDDLKAKLYPVRNEAGEVHLFGHKVSAPDSSGVVKDYIIKEWLPSETFGAIVCILGDYDTN